MAFDAVTYVLSKGYTEDVCDGLGFLKGSPCTIKSTTETDRGTIITFEWTGTSGTTEETTILVKNGEAGIAPTITAERNANDNGAIITITNPDGTVVDTIAINDGASGVATSIDWSKVENKPFTTLSSDSFKVDENGILTVVESGEGNKINSISVNGTEVTPDINKNVNIEIPDAIDDSGVISTNSTYSSAKINELLAEIGDDTSTVELTWAEYQALSEEEKMADVNYFIPDAEFNSDGDVIVSGVSEDDVKTLLSTYGLEDENTLSTKANKQYETFDGCVLKNTVKTIDTDYVFDVSIHSHKEIPSILETELYEFFESCGNNPLFKEEGSEYIDINEVLKIGTHFNATIKLEQYSEELTRYMPLVITVDNPIYGKENGYLNDDAMLIYVEYTLYGSKYSLMYIYEFGSFKLRGAISSGNADVNPIFSYSYSDAHATTKPMVIMDMSLTAENYAEEIGKSLMQNWHEWSREILTFYNTPSDNDFLRDIDKFYLGLVYYTNSSSEKDILQYRVLEFNRIFIESSIDYSSQYNAKYLIKLDETTSYILEIEEAMDFSDLHINDDSYDYNKATLKMCVTTPTITDITF